MNKLRSFTLLESMIVVMLISLFILMPTLQSRHLVQRYQNTFFYTQINQNIAKLQELSIQRRTAGRMVNLGEKIVFYSGTQRESAMDVQVPVQIQVAFTARGENAQEIREIAFNHLGNNSSFPRIYFRDAFQNRTIVYVFQLYRGKFHVRYE